MSRTPKITILLVAGALSIAFSACGLFEDGGIECTRDCQEGMSAMVCHFANKSSSITCGADPDLAVFQCQEAGGTSWVPTAICPDESDETTGTGDGDPIPTTEPPMPWPPDGAVTLDVDSGEHVIDQDLFEALHDDPSLLLRDQTRVDLLDAGYFYLSAQGALSEMMGWQHGDVFISLNDYSLQGMENVGIAYRDISHSTYFTLTIQRDRSPVVLRYRVE